MLKTNYILRPVAQIVSRTVIEKILFESASVGANFRRGNAKNYLQIEMVDTGEFIDQRLDRLSADGIIENPFETLLADLNQRVACGYTKGIIDKRNYIEAKIWDTDRSDAIRLQSLIYGSFFIT